MSEHQTSLNFRENAAAAVLNDSLRAAMRNAADTFGSPSLSREAWCSLPTRETAAW
jgi:hypothetical protein